MNTRVVIKPLALVIHYISLLIERVDSELKKSLVEECGKNVFIGKKSALSFKNIRIGHHVFIGERAMFISAKSKIVIGNYVMFGPNVTIRGGDHRFDVVGEFMYNVKGKLAKNDQDVIIGDDVWIGTNATILKGVKIGQCSIVGAGSIVTRDIPENSIYTGIPPQHKIRLRFSNENYRVHINELGKK